VTKMHVARIGEMRNAYKMLVGISEGKRPLGRRRSSCKDNIRLDPREIWWKGMNRMHMSQDRDQWWAVVNTAMNIWVP
jgi:hypothetical protein